MINEAALAQAFADLASQSLLDLSALQTQCLAKILAGGGQIAFTVSAGLNGKSGAQMCRYDAADLLVIVNRALGTPASDPNAQVTPLTYVDFSDMNLQGPGEGYS
jgi:hypothetical protein